MSESTLHTTLSPEGALVLLRELLPACMVPSSGTALLSASKRPGGPPSRLITDGVPGRGRRRYDRAELREWALGQLPESVRTALRLQELVERYAARILELSETDTASLDIFPPLAAEGWEIADSSLMALSPCVQRATLPEAVEAAIEELGKAAGDG